MEFKSNTLTSPTNNQPDEEATADLGQGKGEADMPALALQIEIEPVAPRGLPVPVKRVSPADILKQVIRNNDNDEATSRFYALDALEDNRAAFWIAREGSQNATAYDIQRTACRLGSLDLAIEQEVPPFIVSAHPDRVETSLDLLIPLNSAAVTQLMDAYEGLDTFREREELIDRRYRVSPLAEFAA